MRRITTALSVAAVAAAVAAGGLSAAAPAQAAGYGCTPMSGGDTYLAAWGDYNNYVVAPGGTFGSATSSWSLTGSSVTPYANSPWNVSGDTRAGALAIRYGGRAVSTQMCVNAEDDRIRFFYKAPYGTQFKVSTTGSSAYGSYTMSTWVTSYSNDWQLTPPIIIPDWTDFTATQYLKVTITNSASYNTVVVDDVLVDPWKWTRW